MELTILITANVHPYQLVRTCGRCLEEHCCGLICIRNEEDAGTYFSRLLGLHGSPLSAALVAVFCNTAGSGQYSLNQSNPQEC